MNRGISWPALWLGIIGFGILYVPVVVMVIYSFNASRLVSVWAGFSTKWYGELMQNDQVLAALGKSLWVAVNAATLSTVFGVLIALAFVRYGDFRFRLLLSRRAGTSGGDWLTSVATDCSRVMSRPVRSGAAPPPITWPIGVIATCWTMSSCFCSTTANSTKVALGSMMLIMLLMYYC